MKYLTITDDMYHSGYDYRVSICNEFAWLHQEKIRIDKGLVSLALVWLLFRRTDLGPQPLDGKCRWDIRTRIKQEIS